MMGGGLYKHWIIAHREVIGENTKQSFNRLLSKELISAMKEVEERTRWTSQYILLTMYWCRFFPFFNSISTERLV
jgi:hypothetical protein